MISRRPAAKVDSTLQKFKRQRHLTDPAGLALLFGSTVVMLTFAWFKVGRTPAKKG